METRFDFIVRSFRIGLSLCRNTGRLQVSIRDLMPLRPKREIRNRMLYSRLSLQL